MGKVQAMQWVPREEHPASRKLNESRWLFTRCAGAASRYKKLGVAGRRRDKR